MAANLLTDLVYKPGRSPHQAGGVELTVAADAASVRDMPVILGNLFFPSIAVVVANWPAGLGDPRAGPGERN